MTEAETCVVVAVFVIVLFQVKTVLINPNFFSDRDMKYETMCTTHMGLVQKKTICISQAPKVNSYNNNNGVIYFRPLVSIALSPFLPVLLKDIDYYEDRMVVTSLD